MVKNNEMEIGKPFNAQTNPKNADRDIRSGFFVSLFLFYQYFLGLKKLIPIHFQDNYIHN